MKNTVVMLAIIATFFLTWVGLASFGSLISDYTIKALMSDSMTIICMFTFGWIPCVIVGIDLSERLGL